MTGWEHYAEALSENPVLMQDRFRSLPLSLQEMLMRADYSTTEAVAQARDVELLTAHSIGYAKLQQIRAVIPYAGSR